MAEHRRVEREDQSTEKRRHEGRQERRRQRGPRTEERRPEPVDGEDLQRGRGPLEAPGGAVSGAVSRGIRDTRRTTREEAINKVIAEKLLEVPNPDALIDDMARIQQAISSEATSLPGAQAGGFLGARAGAEGVVELTQ